MNEAQRASAAIQEFAQAVAEKIKRNRTEMDCPCETCKVFEEFTRLLLREAGIEEKNG